MRNEGAVIHEIAREESVDLGLIEAVDQYFHALMRLPWFQQLCGVFDRLLLRRYPKLFPKVVENLEEAEFGIDGELVAFEAAVVGIGYKLQESID